MSCDNNAKCACTYSSCSRHGKCCECIRYHINNDELPACCFSPEAEKTYNRSVDYFIECRNK